MGRGATVVTIGGATEEVGGSVARVVGMSVRVALAADVGAAGVTDLPSNFISGPTLRIATRTHTARSASPATPHPSQAALPGLTTVVGVGGSVAAGLGAVRAMGGSAAAGRVPERAAANSLAR